MEIWGDYHTHTVYSDGRGTVLENVLAAKEKGLKEVGITDHGPRNVGVGVERAETFLVIQAEARRINECFDRPWVLVGAEADVIDVDGALDVPRSIARELDLLIAGLHPYVLPAKAQGFTDFIVPNQLKAWSRWQQEKARNVNTKALIEAINRYPVDIVSHPDLQMPVDLEELARACVRCGVAMEINTGHRYDRREVAMAALKEGAEVVVNSDAHFPEMVGELEEGLLLLQKINFPPEKIRNTRCWRE